MLAERTASLTEPGHGVASAPSKDLWQKVEEHLKSSLFPRAEFIVGEHTISVQKVGAGENKQALAVYIDGVIKGAWFGFGDAEIPAIVPLAWSKRERSLYKPAERARLEKAFGKRRAREMFPKLEDKMVHYDPYFNTAKSLVTKLKRIEGIRLVKVGYDH